MGFFTKSPITGEHSFISTMPATFCVWGSLVLGIFILTSTVYALFGRGYEDIFTSSTIMFGACFHLILLLLMVWAYLRVRLTSPGYVFRPGYPTKREVRALEEGKMGIITPNQIDLMSREFMVCEPNGSPKICTTCQVYRPERTAHCQATGRCVVRYDHYCPLLSSAIGIGNYKYYINSVIILFLLIGYLFGMGIVTVVKIGRNGWTITLLVYSAIMLVFIFFILSSRLYYLLNNVTTRESLCHSVKASKSKVPANQHIFVRCNVTEFWPNYRLDALTPDFGTLLPIVVAVDLSSKPWCQSKWENWKDVMGVSWWRWFLPLSPRLDKERWWECEFNEKTKTFLRKRATDILREIWVDKEGLQRPEKIHIQETEQNMENKEGKDLDPEMKYN